MVIRKFIDCYIFFIPMQIIRELREEVDRLRELLQINAIEPSANARSKSSRQSFETGNIQEELAENEKLIKECTRTWEEKEKQTEIIRQVRFLSCKLLSFFLHSTCQIAEVTIHSADDT